MFVEVQMRDPDGGLLNKQLTDDEGRACFERPRSKEIRFRLNLTSTHAHEMDACLETGTEAFQLLRDNFDILDCTVTSKSLQYYRIFGKVHDVNGRAVRRAAVVVTDGAAQQWVRKTDRSGSFSFTRLPFGRYTLKVTAAGFLQRSVVLEGGPCDPADRVDLEIYRQCH